MEACPLPMELCELIIDFIAEPNAWWQIPYWRTNRARFLVKYTSICSAWLPRARRILYHTITFHRAHHVELFIQSITSNPLLADMVRELVIKPTVTHKGTYIPFVRDALVRRLRRLRALAYDLHDQTAWAYPPRHNAIVARLPHPITELALHRPEDTMSWLEIFRLIWSLRHLQKLQLQMESSPSIINSFVQRLDAIRRPWACANLKTLVLGDSGSGDCYDFLPECAFGTSVTRLSLTIYQKPLSESEALLTNICLFSSLEELYVCILHPGKPSQDNSAVSGYIAPILTQLPPQDKLRAITFRLVNVSDHERGQFLLELSSHKIDETLAKFSKLRTLSFRIPERGGAGADGYSAERWEHLLYIHLPKLRGTVAVSVTVDHHRCYGCWAEDSDSVSKGHSAAKEDNDSGIGDSSDSERGDLEGDATSSDSEADVDVRDSFPLLERTVRLDSGGAGGVSSHVVLRQLPSRINPQ